MATYPFIGSRVSLVSKSEIRYEGTLYTIDPQKSTIALTSVKCFGTEQRREKVIPPSNSLFQFITFKGDDIESLIVCNDNPQQSAQPIPPDDPAIISSGTAPPPLLTPHIQPSQSPIMPANKPFDRVPHCEFDIQSSNARFDKHLFQQSVALITTLPTAETTDSTTTQGIDDDQKSASTASDDVTETQNETAMCSAPSTQPRYDKNKSFFDDISTGHFVDNDDETRYNTQGQNQETFGDIASGYRGSHNHRGRPGNARGFPHRRGYSNNGGRRGREHRDRDWPIGSRLSNTHHHHHHPDNEPWPTNRRGTRQHNRGQQFTRNEQSTWPTANDGSRSWRRGQSTRRNNSWRKKNPPSTEP